MSMTEAKPKGRPPNADPPEVFVQSVPRSMMQQIERFQERHQLKNRQEAVRRLLEVALKRGMKS